MSILRLIFTSLTALAFMVIAPLSVHAREETGDAYTYKIAVERHLEARLDNVLKEVTNIDDLVVIVSAEVISKPGAPKPKDAQALLPGVPVIDKLISSSGNGAAGPAAPVIIQSLLITILVDSKLSQETIKVIHDVALSAIDFDPDRGDRIEVRKVDYIKTGFSWGSILSNLIYIILAIGGAAFLAAAAFFFLNPFRSLSETLSEINWKVIRGDNVPEGLEQKYPTDSHPGAVGISPQAQMEIASGKGNSSEPDKSRPFWFINQKNIPEAAYLLQDSPSEEIALVLAYLSPEIASDLLGTFPTDLQTEAVSSLASIQTLEPDRVMSLEESFKRRLGYVVGGEDRLAAILDLTDEVVRDKAIADIERKDFNAATSLRDKAKTMESIIRKLENNDLQKLIRRLDPAIFARILNSAPGDVQTRALDSLSEGVAERIKEEMQYGGAFPTERLKREKRNVVAVYKKLLEAGEIQESEGKV